jgi:arylsulfatase
MATSDVRRYLAVGAGVGLAAGAVEAALVHRAGLVFIPFAALAYGLVDAAGFLILWALARLLRRDLLPLAFGLAATLFAGLELGFWLNVRANPLEGAGSARAANLAVIAGALALGVVVFILARRRASRFGSWRPVLAVAAAAFAILLVFFGVSSRASRPGVNCVLISVDALRADHLGAYGYHRPTSPNIDALARRAALWEKVYTQSPGTTGGHACMLTGLYTLSNGAYLNGYPLDRKVETLAEVFAANGYATAAFIDNWYISPALGFGQGFDCFVDGGKGVILKDASPLICFRGLLLYQVIHRGLVPPGAPSNLEVVDASRWMAWRRRHAFFLFLHILDPHSPYVPPRDLAGRFGGSGRALDPAWIEDLHAKSLETTLTSQEQAILADRYDEEVLSADRKVGIILAELERLGLSDKTLVIVTADHGEVMAESDRKEFGHGTLDYGCLHVPLVIYMDQSACRGRVPAGARFTWVAESIDILPTIVDLLGLRDDERRQGRSLLADASGQPAPAEGSGIAYATGDIEARDEYAAVTGRWAYVIEGDQVELYDLEASAPAPAASPPANVVASRPQVADSLQASVEGWIQRCLAEAVVPYTLEGRSVAPGKEALQRLKALGYIQ